MSVTLQFSTTDPSPDEASELAEQLRPHLEAANAVVLDLRIDDELVRRTAVNHLWASMLHRVRDAVRPDHKLLVIVREHLAPTEQLARTLAQRPFRDRVHFLDANGDDRGDATWDLPRGIDELIRWKHEDHVKHLRSRVLRCRGVFSIAHRPNEYVPFRYMPLGADSSLTALFNDAIEDHGAQIVLYDEHANSWLQNTIEPLCFRRQTFCASFGDVAPEAASEPVEARVAGVRERLGAMLDDESNPVLVVVPLIKSGSSVAGPLMKIRARSSAPIRVLTVMIDQSQIREDNTAEPLTVSGEEIPVDYLVPVSQSILSDDDWRLRAALASGAVIPLAEPKVTPSKLGLWDLIAERGCGLETPVPKGRERVRWFPILHEMSPEDALWIAECLLGTIEARLGHDRSNVVILMPDEPSGARPIAQALRHKLSVAVRMIPRAVLDGEVEMPAELHTRLQRSHGRAIVVLDESTVTGGTLKTLGQVAQKYANQAPALTLVVLDLGKRSDRLEQQMSLLSWTPVMFTRTVA
jgi:hypothetical protein